MNKSYSIILVSLLLACNHSNYKEKLLGNIVAKGNMGPEGDIYNGKIDFFDVLTNKKIAEEFYEDGIRDGTSTKYYPNGKILYECVYDHGKINGYANSYDSSGLLENINYFYYNIPMGPITQYQKQLVNKYSFYGFDSKLLFNLEYDSIGKRRITDFQHDFFFYTLRNVATYDSGSLLKKNKVQIFLYKPSPPLYPFKYDLFIVNDKYEVYKIVHEFINKSCWETFEFTPFSPSSKQYFVLRLTIKDSINNGQHTMFKYL